MKANKIDLSSDVGDYDSKAIKQAMDLSLSDTNPLEMVSYLANGMWDVISFHPDIEDSVKNYCNAMYYVMDFYLNLLKSNN